MSEKPPGYLPGGLFSYGYPFSPYATMEKPLLSR